jgi:hypothetical protein
MFWRLPMFWFATALLAVAESFSAPPLIIDDEIE